MSIQNIKKMVAPTLRSAGVEKAAVFGSYAFGKQTSKSDIDILVQMKRGKSLFDLAELKIKLESKLRREVDLVTYNSLNPKLRDQILKSQLVIYEKRS